MMFFVPAAVLILSSLLSCELLAVYHKPAPLPGSLAKKYIACPLTNTESERTLQLGPKKIRYLSEAELSLNSPNWSKDLPDTDALNSYLNKNNVYATIIDVQRVQGELRFAYLSNQTQDIAFQPWSSSKFLAALSAIRMMRKQGIGAHSKVNGMHFGDIITAAHTGLPSGNAHGRSNVHGTWLQNVAGRHNSNWLVSQWLKRPKEAFLGGYSGKVSAGKAMFLDMPTGKSKRIYHGSSGASRTRLSTLTLAEALRRIAVHSETSYGLPGLRQEDIRTLFYGKEGHFPGQSAGGMLAANGNYYRDALGGISNLNKKTNGLWRIFTKTGSANRKTGNEQLVNGVICLPSYDGGRLIIASIFTKGRVGKLGDQRLKSAIKKVFRLLTPNFTR